MLKHRHLRPSIKYFLQATLFVGCVCGFLTILFNAVIQKSYELSPPTSAELAEDPTLTRYLQ